jgi:sugar lactone lactonase YvrE
MRRILSLLVAALCMATLCAHADTAVQQARVLQKQAFDAYKAGKFADAAENFGAALTFRPHHPGLLYNFAATSAKAGNKDDAIRALNEYADMGLIADVEKDDDFASLKGDAQFKAVLEKFRANGKPVGTSTIAARLTEPMLAEGIAYDATGKRFFISSVDQRKIVQIAADGVAKDFIPFSRDGLLGAFGMSIDAKRQLLWVATSGVAHVPNLTETDRRTAGAIAFSIPDHREVTRETTTYPDLKSTGIIGDLVVGPDGRVYAPDSVLPVIHLIPSFELPLPLYAEPRPATPVWLTSDDFVSLQGIAITPDEKSFIVADYSMGLFFIDRATKAMQRVDFAGGTTLLGIDGLIRNRNTLIAVQNGIAPQRIIAMTLNASGNGVASVKVLSANDPNIPEPSLGTMRGDEYCVVANAQWSRFNEDGTRKQDLDPPRIACLKLR